VIIYGINPVLEALRAGRVKALRVGERADDRLKQLLALAAERGVHVARVRRMCSIASRVVEVSAACIRASSPTSRKLTTTASTS